jgi:hypothetical protein
MAGERAKLLEIVDQAGRCRHRPSLSEDGKPCRARRRPDSSENRLPRAGRPRRPRERHEVRGHTRRYLQRHLTTPQLRRTAPQGLEKPRFHREEPPIFGEGLGTTSKSPSKPFISRKQRRSFGDWHISGRHWLTGTVSRFHFTSVALACGVPIRVARYTIHSCRSP